MDELFAVQKNIDSSEVAKMIMDFYMEFGLMYDTGTMASSLCAVGPLQSMIGLAIQKGRLSVPKRRDEK